jgi:signal transduction histidine kinase
VRVADRGPGIPDSDLERVFESFYSTKPAGLGIGLAICRKLIEAHGGALWASDNSGGGAVFQFTLPVRAPGA